MDKDTVAGVCAEKGIIRQLYTIPDKLSIFHVDNQVVLRTLTVIESALR